MRPTVQRCSSNLFTKFFAAAMLTFACTLPAAAEDGVTPDAIVFGQAAVLEGPASALGIGMRAGIGAAFDEANKKGGVHGRQLRRATCERSLLESARTGNRQHQ